MLPRRLKSCVRRFDAVNAVRAIQIDDGSTDSTSYILTSLAAQHPQLTVRRQDRNGGPGAGRNAGLSLVQTEWVAPLGSDDFLLLPAGPYGENAGDIISIWPGQEPHEGVRVWRNEPVGAV
jgi:glycosyltransferase involved in cell wall biosynthesis